MKTSSRKAKGRRLQNKVRDIILEEYPELQEGDVKVAIMGESGVDIHLSPFAQEKIPFAIECKNTERLNIWKALRQAEENAGDAIPLVIFKRNHSDIYATLKLEDLINLL